MTNSRIKIVTFSSINLKAKVVINKNTRQLGCIVSTAKALLKACQRDTQKLSYCNVIGVVFIQNNRFHINIGRSIKKNLIIAVSNKSKLYGFVNGKIDG